MKCFCFVFFMFVFCILFFIKLGAIFVFVISIINHVSTLEKNSKTLLYFLCMLDIRIKVKAILQFSIPKNQDFSIRNTVLFYFPLSWYYWYSLFSVIFRELTAINAELRLNVTELSLKLGDVENEKYGNAKK
jgi:hypothetical protein